MVDTEAPVRASDRNGRERARETIALATGAIAQEKEPIAQEKAAMTAEMEAQTR